MIDARMTGTKGNFPLYGPGCRFKIRSLLLPDHRVRVEPIEEPVREPGAAPAL
jgi:hypothetical protein